MALVKPDKTHAEAANIPPINQLWGQNSTITQAAVSATVTAIHKMMTMSATLLM